MISYKLFLHFNEVKKPQQHCMIKNAKVLKQIMLL